VKAWLAAVAVLAVMAAGCGGSEKTYSLQSTSDCFRGQGYETAASAKRKDSGQLLGVSRKGVQLGLIFLGSADAAKKRQKEAESLPIKTAVGTQTHVERRRNVILIWLTGAQQSEPDNKDLEALDRCLS
jgi:hypothetical protein